MNYRDLSVLLIALVITISGVWINIQKSRKKSDAKPEKDPSLGLFRIAVPLALAGSLLLYFLNWGPKFGNQISNFLGYAMVVPGLLTRWLAVWSLGNAFTVQLKVEEKQELKTDGLYRYLRHPSYTGLLLYYLGLGILMGNLLSLGLLLLLPLWAVLHRIGKEERLLQVHFGKKYEDYQKRSWRLLPFLY